MRRMSFTNPVVLFLCCLFFVVPGAFAQNAVEKDCKPPIARQRWHDDIDKAQKNAQRIGLNRVENDDVVYFINNALINKVDALQCKIEKDSIGAQRKVAYLRGMERLLNNAITTYRNRQFTASHLPQLMEAYEAAMALDKKVQSIEPVVEQQFYDVSKVLLASLAFEGNPGLVSSKHKVLLKYAQVNPDKVFLMLKDNPDVPFRDSLIKVVGYKDLQQLYNYAAADNRLGFAIRAINDPVIKAVSRMAKSGSGQLYFPFLHNILKGRTTIEEIDAVKNDPLKYYRLLVNTRLDYVQRRLEGETITEMKALNAMVEKKAIENFIKPINDLHEVENPAIRFKALQGLNAQELYFVVLAGERDLYTSSYINGVYPAMMQRIGNRGDSLFISVGFDHFKKFIKMAAGYNMLPNFLNSFPDKDAAKTLMTAFVNGLDKSEGLEDGVDVADSYASISETMKNVADEMVQNVQRNYQEAVQTNNKRGQVIYDLLYKLFQSSVDSTIDLSKEFNIPPVYSISYQSLAADTGSVIMQVFFYGDKDGRMNYDRFVPQFPTSLWKRSETKQWVSYTSIKGKPIMVFANKPLDEQSGEVDKAQAALCDYLAEKNLNPTIVVHRGHSYYAPYTIEQLAPSAKIVFLGSCGGYHLIHDVLEHAEDAHIIASKQIGKQMINQPFFDLLNEKLRTGNNIDWIPFWQEFKKRANTEGFDDYIPPHKNLGAIFIKAYKNAMGDESSAGI